MLISPPPAPPAIIITASRAAPDAPPIATQRDLDRLAAFGEDRLSDALARLPGVAVATSGTAGSQTQVRLRGNEARHTLLVIDGIRANDPASNNEPRFELVGTDLANRARLIAGPQSALYGSEAIGGVVAVDGGAARGLGGLIEAGSHGQRRAALSGGVAQERAQLSFGIAAQRSDGVNAFAGLPATAGERDGFRHLSARLRGEVALANGWRLVGSAFGVRAANDFDGSSPVTFQRADTADRSAQRLGAARIGLEQGRFGQDASALRLSASLLRSRNVNRVGTSPVNRTAGARDEVQLEWNRRIAPGQRLVVGLSAERERFRARDTAYGGLSNQDASRARQSASLGWNWTSQSGASIDVAVRHDRFSRFRDATTWRAGARLPLVKGVALVGSYGSAIAQPSFIDLYGFFPRSFRGNPALGAERSRGGEIGLRVERGALAVDVTWFRQQLSDEIVTRYDPVSYVATPVNSRDRSPRRGVELAARWAVSPALVLSGQTTWLAAREARGTSLLPELRRPRRTASLALDGTAGRLSYAASLVHVGARDDLDFDRWPATRVRLGAETTLGARLGWRLTERIELYGRVANALDVRIEQVVGYRGEGRTLHVGLALRPRG